MTDRKLRDWLAVHVMGRDLDEQAIQVDQAGNVYPDTWNPIHDANDTNRLMQAMRVDGWGFQIMQHPHGCEKAFVTLWKNGREGLGHDENGMKAVCLAAKAAKETETT